MPLSTHFANELADHITGREMFISLHSGEPGEVGAHELASARISTAKLFGKSAAGVAASARELSFDKLPAAEITHVGLWDSAKAGRFLAGAPLLKKKAVDDGDSLRFSTAKLGIHIHG